MSRGPEQHRRAAILHAQQLQQQKELSLQLLEATETLLDYPLETKDPALPAANDVAAVKELLGLFQPSDFDALVEERNIGGACGYALCPRPHRKREGAGRFSFLHTPGPRPGRKSVQIVETATLEMWCSDECRERAMYIRVQLGEEPAWVRTHKSVKFDLLEEAEQKKETQRRYDALVKTLGSLQLPDSHIAQSGPDPALLQSLSSLQIHETMNHSQAGAQPPTLHKSGSHMAVDGYEARNPGDYEREQDEDGDWDL